MEKPINVHIAGPDDVEAIFFPLLKSYEDNNLGLPVDPRAVLETVTAMCNGQGGIAGIIDGPHGVAASIAIRAVTPWFSKTTLLTEVWLFVAPAFRKHTRYFKDLLVFADWHREDMSQRLGYDMVFENAVMHRDHLPALQRLYQSHYGAPIGTVFWRGGQQKNVSEQDEQHEPAAERPAVGEPDQPGDGPGGTGRLQRPARSGN